MNLKSSCVIKNDIKNDYFLSQVTSQQTVSCHHLLGLINNEPIMSVIMIIFCCFLYSSHLKLIYLISHVINRRSICTNRARQSISSHHLCLSTSSMARLSFQSEKLLIKPKLFAITSMGRCYLIITDIKQQCLSSQGSTHSPSAGCNK